MTFVINNNPAMTFCKQKMRKCLAGPGGKKNRQKERRLMKGFLAAGGKLPPAAANPPNR